MAKKVRKTVNAKKKVAKKKTKATKLVKKKKSPKTTRLAFDYIKSNQFRVVRIDGIHGGINPRGNAIQMACFSERNPIPQREVYETVEGRITSDDKIETKIRPAIVREVEFEALLNLDTAKSLCVWLDDKIKKLEKISTT